MVMGKTLPFTFGLRSIELTQAFLSFIESPELTFIRTDPVEWQASSPGA